MIKVGIIGSTGKMSKMLIKLLSIGIKGIELSSIFTDKVKENKNDDLNALDHHTDDLSTCVKNSEIIIDFTYPDLSLKVANACKKNGKSLICGTTGLSINQMNELSDIAKDIPIFYSQNMSLGVAIVSFMSKKLVSKLKSLDESFDIEIIESHHKDKADSPSGTSLMLANDLITECAKLNIELNVIANRSGKRQPNQIGISSIRAGAIAGEHQILIANSYEAINISHQAFDRQLFADGAFKAALYLRYKKSGKIYNMQDMLSDYLII